MTKQPPSFFIVIGVNNDVWDCSRRPHQHSDFEGAAREAKRLANQVPGTSFHVLETRGHAVRIEPVTFIEHDTSKEIPF